MIKVDLKNNDKIIISGHANYDEFGKDIICASVSSIVITTINGILEIDSDAINYEDLDNKIVLEVINDNEIVLKLIKNMICMLEVLEKDYPKNIKILRR